MDQASTGAPTPRPPKRRRIDLATQRDVRIELATLYRRVDRGEVDSRDGARRAFILQTIANVIVSAELEAGILAELEAIARATRPGHGQEIVAAAAATMLQ